MRILVILIGLALQIACATEFTIPEWCSDKMMLPADQSVIFRGKSDPGKVVSVRFDRHQSNTVSDSSGDWTIEFPPVESGLKGELVFMCDKQRKIISDVVTGDIWLCAGQSNMQRTVALSDEASEAVEDIEKAEIRYFNGKSWMNLNSDNVQKISAVAVFFAIEMYGQQKSPVGIFVAARGGTSIDAWMPEDAFPDTETGRKFKTLVDDPEVLKAAEKDQADFKPAGQYRLRKWGLSRAIPSSLFKELILPYGDLKLSGVLWYQGENNAGNVEQAREYALWLPNLISTYRELWKNPVLPFIIIQLPSYNPGSPEAQSAWEVLQNVQATVTGNTDNAALVNIIDLGDLNDIHPGRKKEVGVRAAKAARNLIKEKI